jgi:hypothetical protein
MTDNKRGRKETIYPQEDIGKILYKYTENNKVLGYVKYLDVYRHALEMYNNGEISFKLSEDFWRKPFRQGKETIDRYNKSVKENVVSVSNRTISVVNVEDVVYKHHKDLDKMIKLLKPIELELYKSVERENESREKINTLTDKISEQRQQIKALQQKVEELQNLVFQMFEYSTDEDTPLVNMLRTGKTRHRIVENALTNAFNTPDSFYKMFEKRKENRKNIINLEPKKIEEKHKTLADDYDFL